MPGTDIAARMRTWRVVAWALKIALVALLLFALTHPDWPRFADKAMTTRALTYPIAALLVPLVWAVRSRAGRARRAGRAGSYPWDVDALLVAPFTVDVAGNAADLYDTVGWFDDACHFANWAMLAGAVGVGLRRGGALPRWALALTCAGVGAIAAIVWELAEYRTFILDTPEAIGVYRDTLGDEMLGLAGATFAGLLIAFWHRGPSTRRLPDSLPGADGSLPEADDLDRPPVPPG